MTTPTIQKNVLLSKKPNYLQKARDAKAKAQKKHDAYLPEQEAIKEMGNEMNKFSKTFNSAKLIEENAICYKMQIAKPPATLIINKIDNPGGMKYTIGEKNKFERQFGTPIMPWDEKTIFKEQRLPFYAPKEQLKPERPQELEKNIAIICAKYPQITEYVMQNPAIKKELLTECIKAATKYREVLAKHEGIKRKMHPGISESEQSQFKNNFY